MIPRWRDIPNWGLKLREYSITRQRLLNVWPTPSNKAIIAACDKLDGVEDGIIDERYSLTETPGSDPAQRTEWNIRDSDATVIFSTRPELIGGSRLTAELAQKLGKSWLWLARDREGHESAKKLADFIVAHRITVLNVAGPRASEESETQQFVQQVLLYALSAKH